MKAIKISAQKIDAIESALRAVNGKASAHGYTTATEIGYLADTAEFRLEQLGLPKNQRAGAVSVATSGDRVSNSYARKNFFRIATRVVLERRSTGWSLIDVRRTQIGQQGGGDATLVLTEAQSEEAVRRFRSQYGVASKAVGEAA
jgi:hypothetical protein